MYSVLTPGYLQTLRHRPGRRQQVNGAALGRLPWQPRPHKAAAEAERQRGPGGRGRQHFLQQD